jgi:hypothetical protein
MCYNSGMKYPLAKQLKDAEFPFKENVRCEPIEIGGVLFCTPTLEELIEACGDKGFHLACRYDGIWEAGMPDKEQREMQLSQGSTPTEAVALLWLVLHVNGDATS